MEKKWFVGIDVSKKTLDVVPCLKLTRGQSLSALTLAGSATGFTSPLQ
ncbi:hypothetical protein [uncultured Bacteroides sp.]|nr:hypothetical protein [uncultured Bacteroides sp.]